MRRSDAVGCRDREREGSTHRRGSGDGAGVRVEGDTGRKSSRRDGICRRRKAGRRELIRVWRARGARGNDHRVRRSGSLVDGQSGVEVEGA